MIQEQHAEVENIKLWSENNRMVLNIDKTFKLIVRKNRPITVPSCFLPLNEKHGLNYLESVLKTIPTRWGRHFEKMLSKASERMYILRVCKYYGFTAKQLDLHFRSLIMSLFTYAIELWGGACYTKHIIQIDKFINRAFPR